jgi:hypothetical protein
VPATKVPLTLKLHKLMSPSQGIFGILQLPVKVAGVPLAAANQGEQTQAARSTLNTIRFGIVWMPCLL